MSIWRNEDQIKWHEACIEKQRARLENGGSESAEYLERVMQSLTRALEEFGMYLKNVAEHEAIDMELQSKWSEIREGHNR